MQHGKIELAEGLDLNPSWGKMSIFPFYYFNNIIKDQWKIVFILQAPVETQQQPHQTQQQQPQQQQQTQTMPFNQPRHFQFPPVAQVYNGQTVRSG